MSNTKDFLVELGTEELPPKALKKLATAFHDSICKQLEDAELSFTDSEWFATPRRLAVRVNDLLSSQADKIVERQGPAVAAAFDDDGNPKPAALGFAKSCGVDISEVSKIDTPKGQRLAYSSTVKGQPTEHLLPTIIGRALTSLPIPKAMRWGNSNAEFIRPPHWLLVLFGNQSISCNILELAASNQTFGHRFHSPGAIVLDSADSYENKLSAAKVNVSFAARKAIIRQQVEAIANEQSATAVIDEDLLDEVAALVEWPIALIGSFDHDFLSVPAEALIATMEKDQKYFHLVDNDNNLLPKFITVSNIESSDPHSVIAGNERVIRPRLADAKFFYDQDCKVSLQSHINKLSSIVFQKQLGTLFDKVNRVKTLASWIAQKLNVDKELVTRAADLSKCDLMTNMVYEFPELQGVMGKYYAANDGEDKQVAAAMDEIYMPRFAGDNLPSSQVGLVLAIADRIDTLVGIFAIGQIPTGAKDPFALRRAALAVIRLLLEKGLSLDLEKLIEQSVNTYTSLPEATGVLDQLMEFITTRAQSWYQDRGFSLPVIQSVTSLQLTSPLDINKRIIAVDKFNQLEAADSLAAANKRVANILSKSQLDFARLTVNQDLLSESSEIDLFSALTNIESQVTSDVESTNYELALTNLASLKDVIDNFFDNVMVNADEPGIKNNRLALLAKIQRLFLSIADISLLQK
ncbi:MAG: glycine--tRNA ligase subunit beta [Kangiellaceae bacterium]|jgi:glycyl-tRNA synthetase beta chain|nr:glycine--tRNA ligase subunit beta [Kangiellaceae bacterium]